MGLIEHLRELRSRLFKMVVAVGIAFVFAYIYSGEIYGLLMEPLISKLPASSRFVAFTSVTEPFMTYLKAAFFTSLIFASPVILYQAWAFVAPALYEKEKRVFFPLVIFSWILFIGGMAFSYYVVLPAGLEYLLSFSGAEVKPFISMREYFTLILQFMAALGVSFELPLVMLVISKIKLVSYKTYIGYWRYAIIGAFIVGAVISPPDVFSQTLMSLPLIFLYCVGVLLAYLFEK